MQIIIFSLLLFGTAGLVLDSGRVYYTHTQLQAYADQMALTAANELDGQDDAIERAAAAVYGFDGSLPFMEKSGIAVGAFEVESISFYSSMVESDLPQNDMTEAFTAQNRVATATSANPSYVGDPAEASNLALFAVVNISQKQLPSAFTRISQTSYNLTEALGSRKEQTTGDQISFGTVSAATLDRRTCADLSTLVFCNPWEDLGSSPLDVPKDDPEYSVPGRSLMYFAPNFERAGSPEGPVANGTAHGSLYPWNENHQLFRLTNPVADPGAICSLDFLLALADEDVGSESSADYLTARDRCLMARARSETVCWGPGAELAITPAPGPMVSRAINTAFDNWLPPFDQAVTNNVAVGGSGLTRAQFFEPDALATSPYETADRFGETFTDPQDDTPDYGFSGVQTDADGQPLAIDDNLEIEYDTVPAPGMAYLPALFNGAGSGFDPCHTNTYTKYATGSSTGACTDDFIGDYHPNGGANASAVRGRLQSYWQNMYGLGRRSPNARLPNDVTTWYDLYKHERDQMANVTTNGALSQVGQWSEANQDRYSIDQTDAFLKHVPSDYFDLSGAASLLNPGYERRRLRSAMVNCTATIAEGTNESGSYDVRPEDIRIMDVYMPLAPGHFCGAGEVGCELEESIETRMFVELVEDVTEDAFLQRFTAQLVR
ncbi:MAG: Tad domain-containing protein [Pseudomonadota bacterium]